jgi:hypothetical protein
MKKTTLLLAICFAFQFNAISQVLIPDPVFEQALLDFVPPVDTDGLLNGQISTADAEAIMGLSLSAAGVSDFTGIEGFINLTFLDVQYNATAPSLDVSAITGLIFLRLEGCTALEDLNTAGLTSLTEIQASGAGLTSLDVSTNTALQTLNVRNDNNIGVLDLSNNTVLEYMDARNAGITDLDMRNGNNANVTYFNSDVNADLTCIFVDDASAGYLSGWIISVISTFVNNEAECNTLTLEDESQNVFSMFPNPANNTVYVNVNTQDSQLTIYDITGKLVLNTALNLGENSVDISQMASGLYLARFAANGNVQTEKLIIQ